MQEFLEERKLKDLIKKHSEFISFPIELMVEKSTEKEVTDSDDEETPKDENKTEENPDEPKIEDEEKPKEKKTKKIKEVTQEFETLNKIKPIWMRKPDEITKDEYAGFYKSCLLYTSPSPRDRQKSRMPSSA